MSEEIESQDNGSNTIMVTVESTAPTRAKTGRMPQWKVLLHNDDVNILEEVIGAIQEIVKLNHLEALQCTLEAHHEGISLLTTTHREHAELLQEQLDTKLLTVTIEPDR